MELAEEESPGIRAEVEEMDLEKLKKKKESFTSNTPHKKYWYGWYYQHGRISENTILLESFHGKTINDSSLVFAREILRLYPGKYRIYYASDNVKEHQKYIDRIGLKVTLVDINSVKYNKILATAKYIISNASLPIYYVRRDEQVYLQTWHGTPLKTLGKKMRLGIESMYNVQHNFLQASYVMFPNDFTRDVIMRDYNLEKLYTGKLVMSGYPRNQVFMIPGQADRLRKELGIENKTVYAYMPTWRGTSNRAIDSGDYLSQLEKILQKLDDSMRDDQLFYINFHPILKESVSFGKYAHIRPFPAQIDNYSFLNCADALVTDYSSVFFDFSLTRKPIVLFMYDYEQYLHDRGLYLDIRSLPFRQIFDTDEFCRCIREDACLEDSYEDTDYFRQFFPYDDPDNPEKLLKLVLEGDPQDLKLIDYGENSRRRIQVYFPRKANTESDFRTLSQVAVGDDKVVLLYRKWFKKGVSPLLHDKYNDSFNYVITTYTPPRTYLQQFLQNLGVKKYVDLIHRNDVRRCFPGLNVDPVFIRDYGDFEEGVRIAQRDIIPIEAKIHVGKDSPVIGVSFEDLGDLTPEEVIILDQKYAMIDSRPIREEEKKDRYVEYDFTKVVMNYSLYLRKGGVIGILCRDSRGRHKMAGFTDTTKYERAAKAGEKGGIILSSFPPGRTSFMLPKDYERAKLHKIKESVEEEVRERIHSFNLEPVPTEIYLMPYLTMEEDLKHVVRVRVCNRIGVMNWGSYPAELQDFRLRGRQIDMKVLLRSYTEDQVCGAMIALDSPEETVEIPMQISKRSTADGTEVDMHLSCEPDMPFRPLRWFSYVEVRFGDEIFHLKVACEKPSLVRRMRWRNIQCEPRENMLLVPYIGMNNSFKFTWREKNEYDTAAIRRRELLACALYPVVGPFLRRRNIYIVYEKFCRTAQDNSLYFFRFCMDELKGKDRNRFYYIIDKRSADYQYLKQYGGQVIQFMSLKHMLYAMAAKLCISTDSISHLYTWLARPGFVVNRIRKKEVLFLQHGVTALKRVDHLFGKQGTSPMKYFVATSLIEQEIVISEFKYLPEEVPVVGFARWDVLENKEDRSNRFILIMPTWRVWIEDVTDEEFVESEYYRTYSALLKDPRFNSLLEENDLKAVLYLHPKFAQYIETFRGEISDRIICVPFGKEPLNDLMMRCAMLITDYSSVCWDVLYMDKPVIFYQFDHDQYQRVHGSYIDLKTQLPCPRTEEHEDVIRYVGEFVDNGFTIPDRYQEQIGQYFAFRDSRNSKRTYDYLVMMEEGKESDE